MSAVAGYISPSTGQLHNAELSNLGTFIGALCFLAGALLLLPERTEETSPAADDTRHRRHLSPGAHASRCRVAPRPRGVQPGGFAKRTHPFWTMCSDVVGG